MSDIGEKAIERAVAQSKGGPPFGVNECLMRTRQLFGAPSIGDYDGNGRANAVDGWKATQHKHPFDGDYGTVPRGVPFWWSGGSRGDGHVVVTAGSANCWSTDILRPGYYDYVPLARIAQDWGLTPLGWSEDINGVTAWTAPPEPKTRGKRVDAALRRLNHSVKVGRRGERIKRAIRSLRRITPW